MSDSAAIRLDGIYLSYPASHTPVLTDVSFSISSGEAVAIVGPSGCGKTSVTRVVNGLAEAYYGGSLAGCVQVGSLDVRTARLSEIGRVVGSVFQDPRSQFFASLTEDEVAFGMENYGVAHELLDARVDAALAFVKAETLKGRSIHPMSNGEKQKLAIASVNAVKPSVYVFDEPSSNLDMASVEALSCLMARLKNQGCTIVVAEHRIHYLIGVVDRFVYMDGGSIVATYTSSELMALAENRRAELGIRSPRLDRLRAGARFFTTTGSGLAIRGLRYSAASRVIFEGLDFEARSGCITAIVGRNGIGKTTLAKLVCGLLKEKGGSIFIRDVPMSRKSRRRAAYFVMQNTDCQLFGDSVWDELRMNAPRLPEDDLRAILNDYGLLSFKDIHPMALSGGQKQRLTIAVAELIDVPVIILDEPTSGLDYRNMRKVAARLRALASKGKAVLVITHDFEFIMESCDKAIHIKGSGQAICFDVGSCQERILAALAS